jgi:hypothetical protein
MRDLIGEAPVLQNKPDFGTNPDSEPVEADAFVADARIVPGLVSAASAFLVSPFEGENSLPWRYHAGLGWRLN